MHFKNKELSIIAMTISLIVVVGFLFYFLSYIFPVPGSKFILLAPFLSFMFSIPVNIIKKKGVIFVLSLLFAIFMSIINVFMGAAIFSAGLLTEISSLFLNKINKNKKTLYSTAFFPFYSFLTFVITSKFLLGHNFINHDSILLISLLAIIIYILGYWGSVISLKFIDRISI